MRVVSQDKCFSFDFGRAIFWTQYNIIYAKIGKASQSVNTNQKDAPRKYLMTCTKHTVHEG